MSGIYITGMGMPEEDEEIIIRILPNGTVMTEYALPITGVKAIPVPEHGDLIDRDKLEKDIDNYIGGEESRSRFHHWVQVQGVVIPGDKEGER